MNNSKYRELSINTIIFTIGSFGSKIVSFFLVPLYTAVLSTTAYGQVDIATTTVQLLVPLLTLNIQDAVLRFSLDETYSKEDVLKASSRVVLFSGAILLILILIIRISNLINISDNYYLYVFTLFIFTSISNSLVMYLKSKDKMKLVAVSGVVSTIVICVANIIFLLVLKMGANGYMLAGTLGVLVGVIVMFCFGGIGSDLQSGCYSKEIVVQMVVYSAPLIVNSLSWWINSASDRYILSFFCGLSINGIYSVAYKIPSILSMLQSIFYNAWSVSAITEFDENDTDGFLGNVFDFYATSTILAASLIMMLNVIIATFLYSKEFFAAWQYVPILLVATVFNGMGLFIGCFFVAVKKSKDISKTTIVGAIINTALNFALIPFIGALGAAIATMIGYFGIFLARMIGMKKIVRLQYDRTRFIINITIIVLQSILATYNGFFLYQIPFIIALLIVNWKRIVQIAQVGISKIKGMKS